MRISSFTEQTIDGLNRATERLTTEIGQGNVKGFILDLRNNPGGLLDQAIGAPLAVGSLQTIHDDAGFTAVAGP